MFIPGKPFQLSPMFASKAGTYPSEPAFICSTLQLSPGLTYKQKTRLRRCDGDKHSSLLRMFVNNGGKKFYNIGPAYVQQCPAFSRGCIKLVLCEYFQGTLTEVENSVRLTSSLGWVVFAGATTFSITTFSITTLRIMTLSIMRLSINTLNIIGLFVTPSINDTQYK